MARTITPVSDPSNTPTTSGGVIILPVVGRARGRKGCCALDVHEEGVMGMSIPGVGSEGELREGSLCLGPVWPRRVFRIHICRRLRWLTPWAQRYHCRPARQTMSTHHYHHRELRTRRRSLPTTLSHRRYQLGVWRSLMVKTLGLESLNVLLISYVNYDLHKI